METVQQIITWCLANEMIVLGAIASIIVSAKLIAKLTTTKKDDEIVEKADGAFKNFLSMRGKKKDDLPKE